MRDAEEITPIKKEKEKREMTAQSSMLTLLFVHRKLQFDFFTSRARARVSIVVEWHAPSLLKHFRRSNCDGDKAENRNLYLTQRREEKLDIGDGAGSQRNEKLNENSRR